MSSLRPYAEAGLRPYAEAGLRPYAEAGLRPYGETCLHPNAETCLQSLLKVTPRNMRKGFSLSLFSRGRDGLMSLASPSDGRERSG